MKKTLAILTAILLLSSLFVFPVGAKATNGDELIDFIVDVESGRQPRILHIADPQIVDPTQGRSNPDADNDPEKRLKDMEERCLRYIRQVVEKTNPDLILVTGDLVYGQFDDSGEAFKELVNFFESLGVLWAPVFGNHDAESKMGADWQSKLLEEAEHCLFKQRTITGSGNYTVGIRQNGKLTRVFFMLDSNGCNAGSTASLLNHHFEPGKGFREDQVEWYTQTANAIKDAHPGVKLSFQFHIPFVAVDDAMASVGAGDLGSTAVEGENFGYYSPVYPECGAWDNNKVIYDGIKALGVDSIFLGHVHEHSASVVYDGIRFQYGQKCSTYDSANYRLSNGNIKNSKNITTGEPILGGTLMLMDENDGDFVNFEIVLYEEPAGEETLPGWLIPVVICVAAVAAMATVLVLRKKKKA